MAQGAADAAGHPFVAALLTLNPLLNLLCEVSNLGWPAALPSWKHESLTSGGYGIRHLWFLIVLLYLSAAATLAHWLKPGLAHATLRPAWDAWLARHFEASLIAITLLLGLWVGGAIELFYVAGLATQLPQQILRLDQLIEFTPWFLIGAVIARAPALRSALYRFSWPIALLSVVALALDLAFREQLWPPYGRFLDTLAAVGMAQLLIATIKRFADRPSPLVQEIVKASFVIYLFHLPILAGLVLIGKMLALPLALNAALLMTLTLALSWGVWLIVRRSPALRLLYDGTRLAPIAAPPVQRKLSRQGA